MTDKDVIRDRIKHETDLRREALLLLTVTMSGTLSLLVGEATVLRAGLMGLGLILSLGFVIVFWRPERTVRQLLTRLKEINTFRSP